MLTKAQIAQELADQGLGGRTQISNVLDGLAQLGREELEAGEDFKIPGLVRFTWRYTAARAKGEAYKKGETYVGFMGKETVAEQDSPAKKVKIKLALGADAKLKAVNPKPSTLAAFMKTKTAKAVIKRKAK